MSYELNLGFENDKLYGDFDRTPLGDGKYRLNEEIDAEFLHKLQSKLFALLATIPKSQRDCLVITGPVPRKIALTAFGVFAPHFKSWADFDGKKTITNIPQPPGYHQCDPE